jgi:MFS family permease
LETDAAVTIGITFVILCVFPLLTGWIAERKGRRALPWALFGVLGGVPAMAVVALMPRVEAGRSPSG